MKNNLYKTFFFLTLLILNSIAFAQTADDSFKVKGFHIDLRVQVMKMEALKSFAKKLSDAGMNTLVMEWEGTFPFEKHPLIPNQYAYSKEEIKEFITYCEGIGIDVIPLQQSMGHLEYVLRHQRYAEQREDNKELSQICLLEEDLNKALFTDLFTEMAELHNSEYIHIGADEAYLLGHCEKCKKKAEEEGIPTLFADHIKMVSEIVISLGKRPVLWADIALKYPDALSKLPKGCIFVDWNYGWNINRFGYLQKIIDLGFEMWGSPAIRSHPDNFYISNWSRHMNNLQEFIPYCRQTGYNGIVMTSWSTSGVYSPIFEDNSTISDLIPIRYVYPISGSNLLIEAYFEALNTKGALDEDKFIEQYGKNKFGFNKVQSDAMWNALKSYQYMVIDGKVIGSDITVEMLLDSVRQNQKTLKNLKPTANQNEFAHFVLMADIRENYMSFKAIEKKVNDPSFTKKMIPEVLESLKQIEAKEKKINNRFIALNKDLLYPSALETEHELRINSVKLMKERLARIK